MTGAFSLPPVPLVRRMAASLLSSMSLQSKALAPPETVQGQCQTRVERSDTQNPFSESRKMPVPAWNLLGLSEGQKLTPLEKTVGQHYPEGS